MTINQETINAARALLRGFKAFEDVAQALEAVGTADERLHVIQRETMKAIEAREGAESAATVAKANLAEVIAQVEAARAQRMEHVNSARDEALAASERLLAGAKADADALLAKAKARVETAEKKALELEARLVELTLQTTSKGMELADLQAAIDAIRAKLG